MKEKKIVVEVGKDGKIVAETFGMQGTECMDELDRLMRDLALSVESTRKTDVQDAKAGTANTVKNKNI